SYHIILSMLTSSPTQANNPFPTRRSSDLHGPNALIDENLPVVVLATRDETDPSSMTRYEKSVSNIKEVKARDGIVISVITEGDHLAREASDHVIEIPAVPELLSPILEIIPLRSEEHTSELQSR